MSLFLTALLSTTVLAAAAEDWFSSGVLYQVYPRSFADSDQDGNGDLKGILQHVDYFKEIGVSAVWLSPILKSPWKDMGYDISDFREVHEVYGTVDDVKNLLNALHERGIKLLMDLVPNHTSDQHEWFQASRTGAKDSPYRDFYVWKDPKGWNGSEPIPPNNWQSDFGGSSWKWEPLRNQFYLHQFADHQIDLNYENPAVLEAMKDVMRYWLDMGLDGFRVDAVPFLTEDPQLRDEPRRDDCPPEKPTCVKPIYTQNQNLTYEILEDLDRMMQEEYPGRFLFIEAYASIEDTMGYYKSVSSPFNFNFISHLEKDDDANALKKIIDDYTSSVPSGKPYNWVFGNHDNSRVGSRYGEELVDAMNMLALLLPGVGVTYQGEELGMTDGFVRADQVMDKNGPKRDPERTPFQWDRSRNAGFSTSNSTWLPVNPNYWRLNVEDELKSPLSHLNIYKALIHLRKRLSGNTDLQTVAVNRWVFAFTREAKEATYVVVINFNNETEDVVLSEVFQGLATRGRVRIPSLNSGIAQGTCVSTEESLTLPPRSGIVLEF